MGCEENWMSGVLFLCHRFPFPPNKGDKIRSYHILKSIAKNHDVYLGTLIDDVHDWQHVPMMNRLVIDSCVVERRRVRKHWPACIKALLQGEPLSNALFYSKQLQMWIDGLINTGQIKQIYIFSSAMAQYVKNLRLDIPIFTDFVDVDSAKWAQYAQTQWVPLKWIYQLESMRLRAYEKEVAQCSKASIFVSDQEADLFKKITMNHKNPIISIQNGVDTDFFNPHAQYSNPFQGTAKKIVFTGLMDYWPNIDAVTWFAKEIFPKVKANYKHVEFYICGANPSGAVFKLSQRDIFVTGRVPDIRPYLHHADIVVAPLRIARGIQNKVLEAMSMGKVIIASPAALEGIVDSHLDSLWEESSADAWVRRISNLLKDTRPQTLRSHEWIKQHYSWDHHLKAIEDLFQGLTMKDKLKV